MSRSSSDYLQLPATLAQTTKPAEEISPVSAMPADRHPALVYLSSMAPRQPAHHAPGPGYRGRPIDPRPLRPSLVAVVDVAPPACAGGAGNLAHIEYRAATVNKMMAALRQTLKRAWRLGYMSAEEYHRTVDIDSVSGEGPAVAAGRALSFGEWSALFGACVGDDSPAGVRDSATLRLLKVSGLCQAEIAGLQVDDYEPVKGNLTVRGKGNKTRIVPIEDAGAKDALADWLYLRGTASGPLFTRIRKGGRLTPEGLTDQGIYWILHKRGTRAKIRSFTPHDLRRTFAGDLLDAGVELPTVQELMGHAGANRATTSNGTESRNKGF